jgi:hypothetical protein
LPVIAYGLDALPTDGDLTGLPSAEIGSAPVLRLNSDALAAGQRSSAGVPEGDLFQGLCEQLSERCPPWSAVPRRFIAWYFAAVDAIATAHRTELETRLGASSGLYTWQDWRYSAPKPLPRAHLPGPGDTVIRVEIAFWRDGQWLVLETWGGEATPKARRTKADALAAAGIEVVTYSAADLAASGDALLARVLGRSAPQFWSDEILPTGPFAPAVPQP